MIKLFRFYFIIFGQLFVLFGCGMTRGIVIKTNPPEADVYIKEVGSKNIKQIGKTPLTLEEDIINKVISKDRGPVILTVKRAGYLKQQLIINDLGKTSIEYEINLESDNVDTIITKIDDVSSNLFEAQRLIRSGGYDNSLKILENLGEKYPFSSMINELKATAYYLKKDYPNSLLYYDMATKYNKNNADAFKMKRYLEEELGVKRPLAKNRKK